MRNIFNLICCDVSIFSTSALSYSPILSFSCLFSHHFPCVLKFLFIFCNVQSHKLNHLLIPSSFELSAYLWKILELYLYNSYSLNYYSYIKYNNNVSGLSYLEWKLLWQKNRNNATFLPQLIHNFKAGLFLHSSYLAVTPLFGKQKYWSFLCR